jgi:hypothetical protein
MKSAPFTLLHRFLLGMIIVLFFACTQDRNQTPASVEGSSTTVDSVPALYLSLPYLSTFDATGDSMTMEVNPEFHPAFLTVDSLIKALELTYPEIPLEQQSQHGDTLYIQIKDAHFLTQQMGSAGARSYLAEATYAFTEIPSIRVVVYHFEEGDHARPGAYQRADFSTTNRIE